ncbi:MAG: iron-sulfur cluster carrier protein [Vicingaceae bacterium]|nr:MAG: iron-sulfur cluster carrier protein [Vicingaceae bacterium]
MDKKDIERALSYVIEPDLKKDIISAGLVENIRIDDEGVVRFTVRIHNPAMHNRNRMIDACKVQLRRFLGENIRAEIDVIPLEAQKHRDPALRTIMPGVKNIIAVASGKGGVGKSTVSVNLAVGLAKAGYKTGLLDADIYGPSAPIMMGLTGAKPGIVKQEDRTYIGPVESYGVKVLSIGFFAETSQAIVWRGPMAVKALMQMFSDAYWGELDYVIVDLPPGTGDIHLSLVQNIPLTASIVVTTPQPVALADAEKAINMFLLPQINVNVLGIVENMAYFIPPDMPGKKYFIFGEGGAKQLANKYNLPILASIPLVEPVRKGGDEGRPVVLNDDATMPEAKAFNELIEKILNFTVINSFK